MCAFFNDILSTFLAAFRRMYGCQHVLSKSLRNCKQPLDQWLGVGIFLMNLSNAFDCIPHELLCNKYKLYGLSEQDCLSLNGIILIVNNGQKLSIWVIWRYEWYIPLRQWCDYSTESLCEITGCFFLDYELNFSHHVTHICKRASGKSNVVHRMANIWRGASVLRKTSISNF